MTICGGHPAIRPYKDVLLLSTPEENQPVPVPGQKLLRVALNLRPTGPELVEIRSRTSPNKNFFPELIPNESRTSQC